MSVGHQIRDWAPVASAGLASIAATAAWLNVRLSRRQWLAAQRPVLVTQVMHNPDKGQVEVRIFNAGQGAARGVRFLVVAGDEFVAGYAGPAFGAMLKSDELRIVRTELAARTGPTHGVAVCLDSTDRVHVFTIDGRRRSFRLRGELAVATDPLALFQQTHPQVDVALLRKVGGQAIRKELTAP